MGFGGVLNVLRERRQFQLKIYHHSFFANFLFGWNGEISGDGDQAIVQNFARSKKKLDGLKCSGAADTGSINVLAHFSADLLLKRIRLDFGVIFLNMSIKFWPPNLSKKWSPNQSNPIYDLHYGQVWFEAGRRRQVSDFEIFFLLEIDGHELKGNRRMPRGQEEPI